MSTNEQVPVEVLQQALEDAGLTVAEAANQLEWDRTHMARMLGLSTISGTRRYMTHVSYDRAAAFVTGLGLWPVDYGI